MDAHIRKRGNKYAVVVYLGRDEKGKKKYKWFSGYKGKKDAQRARDEILNQINQGEFVEPTKESLKDYMKRWLEIKKDKLRPGTWKSYAWLVNNHLIPHLGHLELVKIKPYHLETLYNNLQNGEDPISKRSVLHLHRIIQQSLDRAVKWGILGRNVAKAVEPPRPPKKEFLVWTEEEVNRFLEVATEDRYYIAFFLAITTGMRKGEILGLRWRDIDFNAGRLHIRQMLARDHSGTKFSEPKTDHGKRSISLAAESIDALKNHRKVQAEEKLRAGSMYEDHDLVVASSIGTPVLHRNLDRSWFKLMEKAGVPKIRFHDLRHTHATLMLKHGVHPKVVSERLGHSSIGITLDTYSHVLPSLQDAAAKQFNDALFRNKNTNKNSL